MTSKLSTSSAVVGRLPYFPSTEARTALSPSQQITLTQTIASTLYETIKLPPNKIETPATTEFVRSYAKDTALQSLHALIWDPDAKSGNDNISMQTLQLAQKIVAKLDIQTLVDLAIIYAPRQLTKARSLFEAALVANPKLPAIFTAEIVPAFTTLLTQSQATGLYGLRKTVHCIECLTRVASAPLLRTFAHSKEFILALAQTYDHALTAIAQSYGGLQYSTPIDPRSDPLDDWKRIWLQAKVAILDTFHAICTLLLQDISEASGHNLGITSERTFDIIFALLEVPASNAASTLVPFLNQSLVGDYQHSYNLSKRLSSALKSAAEKDARLDVLESVLNASADVNSDAGALKLLLRSSGIQPGIDYRGTRAEKSNKGKSKVVTVEPQVGIDYRGTRAENSNKGKSKAVAVEPQVNVDVDLLTAQILDVLPDYEPQIIRAFLQHPKYNGDMEKVIQALLEGVVLGEDQATAEVHDTAKFMVESRRNVFDEEHMDLSHVRIGKKKQDEATVLRDRAAIAQLKADILRRAEEISDDEEEESFAGNEIVDGPIQAGKGKKKHQEHDIDEEINSQVKVIGDGEDSGDELEGSEDDEIAPAPPQISDDAILKRAYINDPKVFDRDGQTRRSKARADLRAKTGKTDEQIEGWRIMLDRNPKKAKILEEEEFAGNHVWAEGDAGPPPPRGTHSRGRGGGRGRGAANSGSSSGVPSARQKSWNDKNKASRGNHNRKKGHDKKMARGGAPIA